MKDKEKLIDEILSRGVGEFIDPEGTFRNKLIKNPEDVVIKFGVDPTRPDLHLGHAVVLRSLRKFQDLGCKVIFLIGDFTSLIGDPTGKSKIRPEISQSEIENNLKTYIDQVGKILKVEKDKDGVILHTKNFSWIRNSDWFVQPTDLFISAEKVSLGKILLEKDGNKEELNFEVGGNSFLGKAKVFSDSRMQNYVLNNEEVEGITLRNFLGMLRKLTFNQILKKSMFDERIKSGSELFLHEMMYPVLQGLDSVVLAKAYKTCDLEVGGTDQIFNMLMGRDCMKGEKQIPQSVLAFKILEGLDGKEKMSKSLDNYIGITDSPADMYGKILSIPDSCILNYFELCTHTSLEKIKEMGEHMSKGKVNPKDLKMDLARQIVYEYHGPEGMKEAEEDFVTKFQKKEIPDEIDEFTVPKGTLLIDAALANGLVESKGEFRRLLEEGAVTDLESKEKISDAQFALEKELTLKIGKKRFAKFIIG